MSKILYLKRNLFGIDYFIGDIHGCFTLVEKALEAAGFNKKTDRLICLGDLTDRGPESHRAADFLEESWFISLQGNHCAFVFKTAELLLSGDDAKINKSADARTCVSNGGTWLLGQNDHELERIVQTFAHMPLAIEYQDEQGNMLAGLIHAEVDPDYTWGEVRDYLEQLPSDFVYSLDDETHHVLDSAVWGRTKVSTRKARGIEANLDDLGTEGAPLVICGHNIMFVEEKGAIKIGNNRLIDHGICKTGVVHLYTFEELAA